MRYVGIERGASAAGDAIIDELTTFINDSFISEDDPSFEPTWVLVAQWDGVHPHPHGSDNHEGIDEEYLNKVSGNDYNYYTRRTEELY